jgi:hypothetical protein
MAPKPDGDALAYSPPSLFVIWVPAFAGTSGG